MGARGASVRDQVLVMVLVLRPQLALALAVGPPLALALEAAVPLGLLALALGLAGPSSSRRSCRRS